MPATMPERFRRWYEYERDAHAKAIASLETVPAERRSLPEFQKAVAWLSHLAMARRVWLGRLGAAPPFSGQLFPEATDLSMAAEQLRAVEGPWLEYLGRLTDEELARVCSYKAIDGGEYRTAVEDILLQMYGHSLYHRGQIATLVKTAGGTPAMTDFIFWCREKVS